MLLQWPNNPQIEDVQPGKVGSHSTKNPDLIDMTASQAECKTGKIK